MCGRPRRRKREIGDAASVGCGHVSGLFTRHLWPLALMKSADRFPISLSRTRRLRHCGLIRSPARPVCHHLSPPLQCRGRCTDVGRGLRLLHGRRRVRLVAREDRPGDPRVIAGQQVCWWSVARNGKCESAAGSAGNHSAQPRPLAPSQSPPTRSRLPTRSRGELRVGN